MPSWVALGEIGSISLDWVKKSISRSHWNRRKYFRFSLQSIERANINRQHLTLYQKTVRWVVLWKTRKWMGNFCFHSNKSTSLFKGLKIIHVIQSGLASLTAQEAAATSKIHSKETEAKTCWDSRTKVSGFFQFEIAELCWTAQLERVTLFSLTLPLLPTFVQPDLLASHFRTN